MLAAAARGIVGRSRVRLANVYAGRWSGLKYKLVCCFKLAADMVEGGIREYDVDRPAFLDRELMGLGVDG